MCKAAFVLSLMLLSTAAHAETAQEMLSNCRKFATATVAEGKVMVPKDFASRVCWGAFAAIQAGITGVDPSAGLVLGVCAPPESTRTQLIAVFVRYADAHPERLHFDFFWTAVGALRDVFPCKSGRRNPDPSGAE